MIKNATQSYISVDATLVHKTRCVLCTGDI
jgi:hypothetical protein